MSAHVPLIISLPQSRGADTVALIEAYRAEGYRQFQIKCGGPDLEDDIDRALSLAAARAPGESYVFDANRSWRRDAALRFARATAGADIVLEQPCAHWQDNLHVRRATPHVFKLDESLLTFEDVLHALKDDALDCASIKLSRHGGLHPARLAKNVLIGAGRAVSIEDGFGSRIIQAATTHLAVATDPRFLLNTTRFDTYVSRAFGSQPYRVEAGTLRLAADVGLGVTIDETSLSAPIFTFC